MSKVLQERGFRSLPRSTETNLGDHVKSISTTVEADMTPIRHNSYEASHINNSIPRKEKDPGSFTLPYYINNVCFDNALADLRASVSVMPLSTYLNLGLGELAHFKLTVELADRTVKYPKGIAENLLVWIRKFIFPVDFIILDMSKDVKVPLILGRPFLSTAHAKIDVFKKKITLRVGNEKNIYKSMKPASSLIKRVYMLGLIERMELDLEARLIGETLVLNISLYLLYGDYIELNDLNVPLELRRDQVNDLMPTIEEVVENMDGYRHQDMGDIILGESFYKASCVEERRFDGLITIHNGNDNVTYQMARSHPRFKHLSNAECNKIKTLRKVFLYGDLARKEIDEVGEVSISWNPMCVEVMLESKRIYNTHSCS
ncbi:retrovirus-related pol polyprotein from transposon TNT 1-94 [Tanacetum coccineum]